MNKAVLGLLAVGFLAAAAWWMSRSSEPSSAEETVGALVPSSALPTTPVDDGGELPQAQPERTPSGESAQAEPSPATDVATPALVPTRGLYGIVRREDGEPTGIRPVKLAVLGGGIRQPLEGTMTQEDGRYAISFSLESFVPWGAALRIQTL